jgi:cytochrome c556
MKKMVLMVTAVVFLATYVSLAADHGQMHEMMMKQGGPKSDDRTELKIPAPMKVMQKKMMRQHLDTLGEISAALAANNLNKAAEVATTKLGWNEEEEKRCSTVEKMTGEPDFTRLGKAVHQKADELANAAKTGSRDKAMAHMAELINNCNACHNKFRH